MTPAQNKKSDEPNDAQICAEPEEPNDAQICAEPEEPNDAQIFADGWGVVGRKWGSLDGSSSYRSSLDNNAVDTTVGVSYKKTTESALGDAEVPAGGEGVEGEGTVDANGRCSLVSGTFDDSPRGSGDVTSPFEVMARNSLSSLQRRQSTASALIREPLAATTDDRNWSWSYLRERFHIKDLEDLFEKYQLRLHHAMLLVYLLLQLGLSIFSILMLLLTLTQNKHHEELIAEITGHGSNILVCISLLIYVYNEQTFRKFPRLHIVISGLVVMTLFATEVALTVYFQQNGFQGDKYRDIKFGNMVYLLLVVYVFLPIPRKWQVTLIALSLSIGDLALTYYALINNDHPQSTTSHIATRMVIDVVVLVCVNLVGVYWRFMSEVAFRRAFLDKRGNLESKFKLDAEKKQEESLLLSVLPNNIMQTVKEEFRNMIEKTIYHANPVSKTNPFPNIYLNHHPMVSILYADIVNFTPLTTKLSGDQLVQMLNDLFGKFDEAAESNDCLRIKILGDCYYCVSGVPDYTPNHAQNCVKVGLEMIDIINEVREERRVDVDMRIGIHSGSVLSGLIGVRKWQFDVWSNDVTIANQMEQCGEKGRIHVTHKTRDLLEGLGYEFIPSAAGERDELLRAEKIETFLIVPKPRRTQRVTYVQSVSKRPRMSVSHDLAQLKNLYEGDIAKKITKVQLPSGVPRQSILNRRRSTYAETLSGKRRTVVTDTSALANFQYMMINSKDVMEKAIESMPLRKSDQWFNPEGINPLFLTFHERKWELSLLRQADPLFKYYILCTAIVFVAIFIMQEMLMPDNKWGWVAGAMCLILLLIVMPLVWVATFHHLIVDPHDDVLDYEGSQRYAITEFFYNSSKTIIASVSLRIGLYILICVTLYICAVINVVECQDILENAMEYGRSWDGGGSGLLLGFNHTNPIPYSSDTPPVPPLCCDPWYFTYSITLTLLVAWTFFRMHFLLKFIIYVFVVSVYGYFVLDFAEIMYNHENLNDVCPPLTVTSLSLEPGMGHFIFILMIFFALHMMDRQMEYIIRLDFKWKQELELEKKEAETTHYANKLLLQNILPQHVADMYLTRSKTQDELYHESYNHVSVIFASIPNYREYYRENVNNQEGRMCLKVLNEIISDFDMITYSPQFQTVEKIKVVGSTYMAACGLQPGRRYSDESNFEERDKMENVATLAKFALAMKEKLDATKQEYMQSNFKLRVGIDVGPVIAGVVGQHKPMYDIWGNTVNVASRMDYTGQEDKIHVTADVAKILEELGWSVECRGEIFVKGKGNMTTYFVDPDSAPTGPPTSSPNHNNNIISGRKGSQDLKRRRSSQISLNSLKAMLSSHRGSLDITKKEADTQSTQSLPLYRPVSMTPDVAQWLEQCTLPRVHSADTAPRSSVDGVPDWAKGAMDGEGRSQVRVTFSNDSENLGRSDIQRLPSNDNIKSSHSTLETKVSGTRTSTIAPKNCARVTFRSPQGSFTSLSSSSQESLHKLEENNKNIHISTHTNNTYL